MANFDFRTTQTPLDFRLPPEVVQLLANAMQQKNQMYQGLGQDLGQGVMGGIAGYQQGKQQKRQKMNQQNQTNQIQDFLRSQQSPIQRTVSAQGQSGIPVASYNDNTGQADPMTTPNPNAQVYKSMEKLPFEVLSKVIGPMAEKVGLQEMKNTAPLSKGMQAEVELANKKNQAGGPGTPKGRLFDAKADQSEISGLSMIEKNIDPATASKSTPLGAAAQSVRRVYNGLTLLNQPIVTKTALEATTADIDSILTQAGATVEGRKMLAQSNVKQNLQNWKAFLSKSPDKVPVSPGVKAIYSSILKDLGPVSQKFVTDLVKQRSEYYRSKGEKLAGTKNYNDMVNRVVNSFTIPSNLMQDDSASAQSGWSIQRIQ